MKNKIFSAFFAAGFLLVSSMPVYAFHGGHGGHGHFRGSIWIGAGLAPWWGPSYPYFYSPYYAAPPVVIEQSPDEYIQQPATQAEEPNYWYYCQDAKGYYPYVKKCPNGWLKVVPSPVPPDEGE